MGNKITVIDSIMGSGKTTWDIRRMRKQGTIKAVSRREYMYYSRIISEM